ncbi:MAG: hypothetical protein EXS14_08555 [Planctomycetes bacterium]|nr:hypothetical protein [Planctomycetota bacterium]
MKPPDVLIAGAGPAGSLLAILLGRDGIAVTLIDRPHPRQHMPEETIPAAAGPVLERLGLKGLFAREHFFGTPRRGVCWNPGAELKVSCSSMAPADRGFKVLREVLDHELRVMAVESGAKLLDATVQSIDGATQSVRLRLTTGREQVLQAPIIVNALGARGARLSARVCESLPAALALTAHIDDAGAGADITVVEAVREGWLWWMPRAIGGSVLTLMADADEVRQVGAKALFECARRGSCGPAQQVTNTCDSGTAATPELFEPADGVLHCGDAAASIDPLSSQGLLKAMISAERTAAAIRTLLSTATLRPAVESHLRSFHSGMWKTHAQETLDWYGREQRFPEAPFWIARHAVLPRYTTPSVQLPSVLVRRERLIPAPILICEGGTLRERTGYLAPHTGEAFHQLGPLSIDNLLRMTEIPGRFEDVCRRALGLQGTCLHSEGELRGLLAEAFRLGFVESFRAEIPRAPSVRHTMQ